MTNEKDFGQLIDSDKQIIANAEDLLCLQGPDLYNRERCTVCSCTWDTDITTLRA